MRFFRFASLPLALSALTGELAAQQETVIRERCADAFHIEATRVRRLGDPNDTGIIGTTANFALDGRGRYLIFRNNQLHVFDSAGSHVSTVGRAGEGPGEYRGVRRLNVAGDTIHLVDARNARWTTLSPTLQIIEQKRLAIGGFDAATRLPSGDWVVSAQVGTPDRLGLPLHVISSDGRLVRSFGAVTPKARIDVAELNSRLLTPAGRDRVWVSHIRQYRLELWDTSNRLLRRLVRDVSWFRPWELAEQIAPDKPWQPRVRNIHVDAQGVLWVLIIKSKPNWRDYVYEHAPGAFTIREPIHQALSVVVEAVDVNRACILARHETDEYLMGPLADNYYLAYHETPDGIPYLDTWHLKIIQGARR